MAAFSLFLSSVKLQTSNLRLFGSLKDGREQAGDRVLTLEPLQVSALNKVDKSVVIEDFEDLKMKLNGGTNITSLVI